MKASKQYLAILVLIIGLGCVFPNTVVLADDELNVPDYDAVVIDAPSGLRVRSAPNNNGAQIASLWNGQKVRITHHVEPSGWRKLLLSSGRAGYALGTYLTGPPDDDGGSTTLRDWQSVGVTARQNDSYVGIQIPQATANIWEAALYRRDVQLQSGTRYRLLFDAKAESNRTFNTWIGYIPDGSSSYVTISGEPHTISDGWKGFSHEFVAPVSVSGSQLSFQLGNSDVDVELNNVQLSTVRVTDPGGGSGGCSGASPSNRFASPVSRTISHPEYETRGYQVWLRSGPSESCDANPIYASDNMAVSELGTYAGSDQSWSLLRFTHNGSTTERWAETKFLEGGGNGGGGSGGCSGASPSYRFENPVSRTISHPDYESRGYLVWLRSGPSESCDANPIYASDNMAVSELGTYAGSDQSWSLLRFTHNGSTTERWAETKFLEGGGNGGGGGPLPPINPPPGGVPVVIFDTDMGPDIDDALALAALHEYADQGAAHIAAVTLSRNSNTGAQYVDQVNTFYNRPDIPIGVYRNTIGSTGMDANNRYTSSIVNQRDTYPFNVNAGGLPDGHELMRAVLEASADNSVIIIQVGFSTNTAELLNRYPDLVRRKTRLLSVMAGDFVMPGGTSGRDEFNIEKHPESAQTVFSKWPNQLVVSEAGLGSGVPYPFSSIQDDFNYTSNHIIKDSYLDPQGTAGMSWHPQPDMYSWDITSVIAAIEPGLIPVVLGPGTISVSGAKTSFNSGGGNHYVLAEGRQLSTTQHRQLTDRMTQLVSAQPRGGTTPGGRDLQVNVIEEPFQCDGKLRTIATVSGFNSDEDVIVNVSGDAYPARPAVDGVRSINWRCYSGDTSLRLVVTGQESRLNADFTVRTSGNTERPSNWWKCYSATQLPRQAGPVTAVITSSTPAITFTEPFEPYADGCRSSLRTNIFDEGQLVTVIGYAGDYLKIKIGTGSGFIRASVADEAPADVCDRQNIARIGPLDGTVTIGGPPSNSVPVYAAPCAGTRSEIRRLVRGADVEIYEQTNMYFHLRSGGWILRSHFRSAPRQISGEDNYIRSEIHDATNGFSFDPCRYWDEIECRRAVRGDITDRPIPPRIIKRTNHLDLNYLWSNAAYDFGVSNLASYWYPTEGAQDSDTITCYGRDGCYVAQSVLATATVDGATLEQAVATAKLAARWHCYYACDDLTAEIQMFLADLIVAGFTTPLSAKQKNSFARRGRHCADNSFTADTEVLMGDGSLRAIESVRAGDLVLATDPETGRSSAKPVERIITGAGTKDFVDIVVDGDVVTATGEHPFWLSSVGQWSPAKNLKAGDKLLSPSGAELSVGSVKRYQEHANVFNLTVEDIPTYYVEIAGHQVLVHNCRKPRSKLNWNPRSVPTFGHTFKDHGKTRSLTSLRDRARSTGNHQGQWLEDDDVIAEYLERIYDNTKTTMYEVPLPQGIRGRNILPDGSIGPVTRVRIIPRAAGGYTSAFPIQ